MDPIIEQLKGKLIVSCQAYMGEPLPPAGGRYLRS